MKRLYIITIFIAFLINARAQTDFNSLYTDTLIKGKSLTEKFDIVKYEINNHNYENIGLRLALSKQLIGISDEINSPKHIGLAYYELGYSYEMLGENDKAIEACFKALKHLEVAQDTFAIAMVYNEIGIIYIFSDNDEDLELSIDFFRKYLELQKILKDTSEIAGAYSNIGQVFNHKNNADSSLFYALKSMKLWQEIGKENLTPIAYGNIGGALFDLGNTDSAYIYFQKAEYLYKKYNNTNGLFELCDDYFYYYLKQTDFENAKYWVEKRFELANKIGSKHTLRKAYQSLSIYYNEIEDYKKAFLNFRKFKQLSDSIRNDKTQQQVANLQAIYDLDKKEKQIELFKEHNKLRKQEEENRKQKFTFLMVVVGLILVILGITIISIIRKHKQEKTLHRLKNEALEKEKVLTKIELEKSQIKEKELNTKLEYKSKQLTSHALNMMKKNQFLQEMEGDILNISKQSSDEVKTQLRRLNTLVKRNNKSEKDWELFKNYFEEVNQGFYVRLNIKFPGLSSNDYKLCALIKLNMNIKESASVLNISPESVKTARYRLRKKLEMKAEEDLHEFIGRI